MSVNEMPVATGMQWHANASSGEDAMYDARKKNVHELRGGERQIESGLNEHGDFREIVRW